MGIGLDLKFLPKKSQLDRMDRESNLEQLKSSRQAHDYEMDALFACSSAGMERLPLR